MTSILVHLKLLFGQRPMFNLKNNYMKTSYKSVPVVCSIIGTKTRKSMYIYNVKSLNGDTVYQDRYVPVKWGNNVTIEWERTTDEFVQFPLSLARPIMIIPKFNEIGVSNISQSRVNGKVQSYYEMTDRYIVYIPMWLFLPQKDDNGNNKPNTGFKTKYTKVLPKADDDLFINDDSPYTIAEDIAYKSEQDLAFDYRPSADKMLSGLEFENDSLAQWEIENPEYANDDNLLFN